MAAAFRMCAMATGGLLLAMTMTVKAQPVAPALTARSPCLPAAVDPAATERAAMTELVLRPMAPAEYRQAFAALQAAAPPADEGRIREALARDWPNLCRYQEANAAVAAGAAPTPAVVFMGDSITEGWVDGDPGLFANGIVGRGIGGQTTPQMLVRFRQDVVALRPRVVHLMAGTNDIAGNTGPASVRDFQNNVLSMLDLAAANGIGVVLAGVPPSRRLYWRGDLDPRASIRELNAWLKATAAERGLVFVDYGAVLADAAGGLREDLGNDGVHPNRDGYAAMRPLAQRALAAALDAAEKAPRR